MLTSSIQVLALLVLAGALLQVLLLLATSLRQAQYQRLQRQLALQLLEQQVEAGRRRNARADDGGPAWRGFRKFKVMKKAHENEKGDVCSLYLAPHDGRPLPNFRAGQFLTFQFKLPGEPKPTVRCYSLSASPNPERYRISVKRVPPPRDKPEVAPGLVSGFVHSLLKEDDLIDVKAPSGSFTLDLARETPIVMIAGGIGVTPLLCMVQDLAAQGVQREVWFFYGVRDRSDLALRGELDALNENSWFRLQVCLDGATDSLDAATERRSRVSVELFKEVLPSNNYDFYICGPPPMMKGITQDLEEWGVPRDHIFFEAFGPASVKSVAPAPAAQTATPSKVTFRKSGKELVWDGASGSLLEFAEDNGVVLNSGCRSGSCGECETAIRTGEIQYLSDPDYETQPGSCLTCCSVPKGDLVLDA